MDNKRSPRYPAISLADAIEGARSLWNKERRTAVQGEVLAKALGYGSESGPSRTKAASMRQYGLLEKYGNGLRLSDLGMLLVHNQEGNEQFKKASQVAALSPELFLEIHKTHADASEDAIKSYLILHKGFSDAGARLAAKAYRDNLSLAKLGGSGYTGTGREESKSNDTPKVGDQVQWEAQGVLQFPTPRRIRALSEDGTWAFVDGSTTGIPVKELSVVTSATSEKKTPVPPVLPENTSSTRQDVFSLAEGEAIFRWPTPLSAESAGELKSWIEILQKKIARSVARSINVEEEIKVHDSVDIKIT